MEKIRRNTQCPCGSGRKYKRCCGAQTDHQAEGGSASCGAASSHRYVADEIIRVKQQGLGRPINTKSVVNHAVVIVGDTEYSSNYFLSFSDFLSFYITTILGKDWWDRELTKSLEERHPVLQWHDSYCRYKLRFKSQGKFFCAPMVGSVYSFLGLAYSLYLLHHNVELQSRLISRLKHITLFQGAYYELIVANCLIRAGFELELEDETNDDVKHCEFSARSKETDERYWVEAKMRSVSGVLGKTREDGSSRGDPTSQLTNHLGKALRKPAAGDRMIFIDLNHQSDGGGMAWQQQALRRLRPSSRDLKGKAEAYVFVTNMPFHRALESPTPGREILAYGLGKAEFGASDEMKLSDQYRRRQKHIDAHKVVEAFMTYPQLPDTLDGRPASEALSTQGTPRIRVGEKYYFESIGRAGEIATVIAVTVEDEKRRAFLLITKEDGGMGLLTHELSVAEYNDYKKYGDAFFGIPSERSSNIKDIRDFFALLVETYSELPKERLLALAEEDPDIERLKKLDHFDLVLEICERGAARALEDGEPGTWRRLC